MCARLNFFNIWCPLSNLMQEKISHRIYDLWPLSVRHIEYANSIMSANLIIWDLFECAIHTVKLGSNSEQLLFLSKAIYILSRKNTEEKECRKVIFYKMTQKWLKKCHQKLLPLPHNPSSRWRAAGKSSSRLTPPRGGRFVSATNCSANGIA